MNHNRIRNHILALTITLLLIIFLITKELKIINIENIQNFISGFDILAPLIFIILYIILTLIGISAVIFTILAGTIFGLWLGWLLVIISAFISASIAFFISRHFKKYFPKRDTEKKSLINSLITEIEKNAKKNGFITIATLRISFLPYIPLSYAAGLVKNLRWKDFALATFTTNLIGSFFFILLGFSITQSLPFVIMAIILIIILTQIPKIIKKIQKQ